jgi:hypothetical protein
MDFLLLDAIFVAVGRLEAGLLQGDVAVQLIVLVGPFFPVVISYLFAVRAVSASVVVCGLEVLVLALEDASAVLLIVPELANVDLVLFVIVDDPALAVLHVVLELSLVDGVGDFELSLAVLLAV